MEVGINKKKVGVNKFGANKAIASHGSQYKMHMYSDYRRHPCSRLIIRPGSPSGACYNTISHLGVPPILQCAPD